MRYATFSASRSQLIRGAFGRTVKGGGMMERRAGRGRVWLLVLAALAVVAVCLAAAVFFHPSLHARDETLSWSRHFSPEAWQAHPQQRDFMALDLALDSEQLRGKARPWLYRTLGQPDGGGPGPEGVMFWNAPSPQRPDDHLFVQLHRGMVVDWGVTQVP
jgi:hypothetical protein